MADLMYRDPSKDKYEAYTSSVHADVGCEHIYCELDRKDGHNMLELRRQVYRTAHKGAEPELTDEALIDWFNKEARKFEWIPAERYDHIEKDARYCSRCVCGKYNPSGAFILKHPNGYTIDIGVECIDKFDKERATFIKRCSKHYRGELVKLDAKYLPKDLSNPFKALASLAKLGGVRSMYGDTIDGFVINNRLAQPYKLIAAGAVVTKLERGIVYRIKDDDYADIVQDKLYANFNTELYIPKLIETNPALSVEKKKLKALVVALKDDIETFDEYASDNTLESLVSQLNVMESRIANIDAFNTEQQREAAEEEQHRAAMRYSRKQVLSDREAELVGKQYLVAEVQDEASVSYRYSMSEFDTMIKAEDYNKQNVTNVDYVLSLVANRFTPSGLYSALCSYLNGTMYTPADGVIV